MTSGSPDPDRLLEALGALRRDDPGAWQRPTGEVSRELVRGGYPQEDPGLVLVAEMLEGLEAKGGALT